MIAPVRPAKGPAKTAVSAPHPVLRSLVSRPYPAVMGVLNVTPDSFSDGGQFLAPEHALAQARRLVAEGADIIDIGGESTRPYGGMAPISAEEELCRLQPILPEIVALGVPVSIDSMKAQVAAFALDAGAVIVNDVWGLQRDPGMAELVAARISPPSSPVRSISRTEPASPAATSSSTPASASARAPNRALPRSPGWNTSKASACLC